MLSYFFSWHSSNESRKVWNDATIACTLKLVSHWHANFSRLFCEFCRGTFARHSCECRENFLVLQTSRELVAKFFNMLKNFMRIFSPKYFARLSRDGRATFVRVSRTCRREILANLQCEIFATLVRMSRECRTTVAQQSCENLATIWRENKTKRHSYECRATLARMSRDCCTNLNENKLHSRETLSRMSRDCRATVARLSRDSRAIYFQN